MSYVVTIFTEKHLYRVNIEEGTKYTIGSGEKDALPMSELGVDGQLGICFHAKKQSLKLNARGDRFLICSDGVSDMVPVDFLETMMQQTQSTAKCVDAILTAALDAGGKDNITAIVLEINR